MATSPCTGGYNQDFLDPPAKLKEFECPLCLSVTREPNLTNCCGQHFCQSCIYRVITDRNPCPFCKSVNFSVLLDKKQKRKVLGLKVCCSAKARGCSWTGELGELSSHTDTPNGNCQFVDMSCPNSCGKSLQRCLMGSHLSGTCPKRPFSCEHCHFKSTYEEVSKHYSECTKFPVPCPNKCQASVQWERMSEHLNECPLQLVECEYNSDGCKEQVRRKDLAKHLEERVHTHMQLAFTSCQKQNEKLERVVEEIRRERDKELERLAKAVQSGKDEHNKLLETVVEEVLKEQNKWLKGLEEQFRKEKDQQQQELERSVEVVRREKDKQLKEKDQQITWLQWRVAVLEKHVQPPVLEFTTSNYSEDKFNLAVDHPVFYMYPTGAKVKVHVRNRAVYNEKLYITTMLCVELHQLPGEFDNVIQWPAKRTIIVQLLNQLGDHNHISGRKVVELSRPKTMTYTGRPDPLEVNSRVVEGCSKGGILYLRDNCLKFRVFVE